MSVVLRALRTAGGFLLGLFLACWAIRANLPVPTVPVVQAKLEHLMDNVDDYNTLLVGSSRIYHQIIPELFDNLMAEKGIETRTFNLGIDGMRPPEDAYVLDKVLEYKPGTLKWVVVELAFLRMPVDSDKRGTIRAVYWHDWERLVLLARRAFADTKKRKLSDRLEKLQEPLADLTEHWGLFVENMTNLGRGDVLTQFLTRRRPRPINWHPIGERRDGFIITGRPEEILDEHRIPFERERRAREETPAREDLGEPASQHALEIMLRKIRAAGATPILVVPPTTAKKNFVPAPELGDDLIVLNFSDIRRYAVLYENRYRLDTDHVNTEGAKVFTVLFADAMAAALTRKQ